MNITEQVASRYAQAIEAYDGFTAAEVALEGVSLDDAAVVVLQRWRRSDFYGPAFYAGKE